MRDVVSRYLWATVIVRNSAQKLIEWIVWHFLMGVQHFLVYDNVSVDNTIEVLKPFIRASVVTLIPYVRDMMQIQSYNNALQRSKHRNVHWLMMMDVDEFVMTSDDHTLLDVLFSLDNNSTVGSLQLQWEFIVPPKRGHLTKPVDMTYIELLMNGFKAKGYTHPKCTTKSIVKVDVTAEAHVHYGKFEHQTKENSFIHGSDIFGRTVDSPWAQKPW